MRRASLINEATFRTMSPVTPLRPPDAKWLFEKGDGMRHNAAASVLIVTARSPRSS
jgi:hypothetical protein